MSTLFSRKELIDLVRGQRPGYWIEILHREEDGATGYLIHCPPAPGATRTDWREGPILPLDWEAVEILAPKYAHREDAAATLPQYDEGRTFQGDIEGKAFARACAKWSRFD